MYGTGEGNGDTIAGEVEQGVSVAEDSTMVGVAVTVTMEDRLGATAEDWVTTALVAEETTDELDTAHDGRGATLSILETTQEEASSV